MCEEQKLPEHFINLYGQHMCSLDLAVKQTLTEEYIQDNVFNVPTLSIRHLLYYQKHISYDLKKELEAFAKQKYHLLD